MTSDQLLFELSIINCPFNFETIGDSITFQRKREVEALTVDFVFDERRAIISGNWSLVTDNWSLI